MRKVVLALVVFLPVFGLFTLSRSRTYQVLGTIIARVETTEPIVALTFDDGPLPRFASTILATLRRRDVRATFFLIGKEVEAHPGEARMIVDAGHEIANHSYSHARMLQQSAAWMRDEIVRTDRELAKAGAKGVPLFRPPYGKKLFTLPYVLWQMDRPAITWDVEPESDPRVDGNAPAIRHHVLENARAGSIILLHPWAESRDATREAIDGIVDGLKAKGFTFVTVSELLKRRR